MIDHWAIGLYLTLLLFLSIMSLLEGRRVAAPQSPSSGRRDSALAPRLPNCTHAYPFRNYPSTAGTTMSCVAAQDELQEV